LAPGGVMAVNMNLHADGSDSINRALGDTVSAVFDTVCTADVPHTTNRELFAADGTDLSAALTANLPGVSDGALRRMMEQVSGALTPYVSGSRTLTDDRAPVEVLGMRTLDGYIAGELSYYKELFRTKGISGLLQEAGG